MTNGDPSNQTQVLMLDIYKKRLQISKSWLGAAAESFILFLIVMGITLIQMRVMRTDWEY